MTEAIILAGGLGTRLRSVVPDLPKCMAPVSGKPFLSYLVEYFQQQGISRFIFALGYKSEVIENFLETKLPSSAYCLSKEEDPLGTGGAIKQACSMAVTKNILVLNGDTFFRINVKELDAFHRIHEGDCTLSLKPMKDFSRYGVVELAGDHSIKNFLEKKNYESGLINGGIYALNVARFLQENFPEKFSFETDYLEKKYVALRMFGLIQDTYFIDIGIPEDYERAQLELVRSVNS